MAGYFFFKACSTVRMAQNSPHMLQTSLSVDGNSARHFLISQLASALKYVRP
jgi:hypothetical protein